MLITIVLLGCRALRLLASPGKSGSAFFLSDDDRFLIKTVQQEEMRLLLDLIPKYYRHVETNPGTLLTRFHGLHMVKPVGGAKSRVRFHHMSLCCVCVCVCVYKYVCSTAYTWSSLWERTRLGYAFIICLSVCLSVCECVCVPWHGLHMVKPVGEDKVGVQNQCLSVCLCVCICCKCVGVNLGISSMACMYRSLSRGFSPDYSFLMCLSMCVGLAVLVCVCL